MSVNVIAKRYAEALFQIGKEKDTLDTLVEQFTLVKNSFHENEQVIVYLKHPRIQEKEKLSFINKTFDQFETVVINTLKLLVERHRIEMISSIIEQFISIVHEEKGIAEVTVQSVRELTDKESKHLKEKLAKRFEKETVRIHNIVNPEILGGLHIQVGNTIIDGTVRSKLQRMERKITSVNKQ